MYKYLIRILGGGELHAQEPDPDHHFETTRHLDTRGTDLGFRVAQSRAVQQFHLPRDDEYLKGIPNDGLQLGLWSYLILDRRVGTRQAAEAWALKAIEVEKLRLELGES
ncbi:uncharacterized protein A4U43_C03F23280 [Asparagus officinalis]|uniref:Uncharacterized protein n=1 Tax=Asparagus officinalis TaxID=4686 RepID=A0A5P1FE80_ASPOF|nr:uncharacterized protein A4U43_C03F23280 [Asparagus officinalis]